MKVLIACESSGRVREAFRARGHDAWSCDLNPAEDNSPYHHQGDVLAFLASEKPFDLVIGHPPCTYLCNSGVRWMYKGGKKEVINAEGEVNVDPKRLVQMEDGVKFWRDLFAAIITNNPLAKVAFENPVMHGWTGIRPADQFVQPWWFGDEAFKATGLWLRGLPKLVATNKLTPPTKGTPEYKKWSAIHNASPGPQRAVERSRTFPGIAEAMASQWG